ncbi:hypothetical protein MCOR27_004493 [Pyricularia oryzae]|uniref:Uncharacterized protein n=4 Tax=Pyricularia TaxID=48558 RepID=A0ABQ8NKM9_PYRGI|nr:hypothetical protein OOU_Y34scaffold00548g75 [Pyricularia oryzae Y34]KAH8847576.1 hypothetical protein MCOR01_000994 [Pyricularia oryzae]KAI6297277.1 hypothetical protein MCOR33_006332 [Pyricularia grisea]KAH9430496.1 hypothetical protein MCOR02_010193 [Pyricularia oryzae]KAI6257975.1 hypothetical protein MCOR19_005639 [Pyricularia oryzae]
MKTYTAILVAVLAAVTTITAAPATSPVEQPFANIVAREQCFHPGECGWTRSGQCEYHCDGYGGFMYMQGCGWGRKRCCCAKKT